METKNKIKYFLENPEIYKRALVIDDEWGTGKSYLIKTALNGSITDFKIEGVIKRYYILDICDVYEEMNILQSIYYLSQDINTKHYTERQDYENNRDERKLPFSNFFKNLMSDKDMKNPRILDYNSSTKIISEVLNSVHYLFIKNKKYNDCILVIDELERCNDAKTLEWLLLKISKLQENYGIRMIIIMNSKKLCEEIKETYEEWKEKIVSMTININNENYIHSKMESLNLLKNDVKNIRLIENYESIDKIIEQHIKQIKEKSNIAENEMIKNEIKTLKNTIFHKLINMHENNKDEDDYIYNIMNMEYFDLYSTIDFIFEKFNNSNYKTLKLINNFYEDKAISLQYQKSNKEKKKKDFFKDFKEIMEQKNIYELMKFKTPLYRIDQFDKTSFLSYLDLFYNNFTLNKQEKRYFNKLAVDFLGYEKKIFKQSPSNEEKFIIWDRYVKKTYSDSQNKKQNYYENIIYNKTCLNVKDKDKIYYKIKQNISYMYKELFKCEINEDDFNKITRIAMFNAKYNKDIVSLLLKKIGNGKDTKLLHAYIRDYYLLRVNLTVDGDIIRQNILDNIKRLHNINPFKRNIYSPSGQNVGMVKFEKKYRIQKLDDKIFIDF